MVIFGIKSGCECGCGHDAKAKEMKNETIDDFIRQGVFLLQKDANKDIRRAGGFAARHARLLGGEFRQAHQRRGGVEDGDFDLDQHAAYDVCFAEGAGAAADEGEEEPLEERCGLIQSLFERVVEMHIQFFGLVDVFAHAVENYRLEKALGHVRFGGDEDARGFVAGVGGPGGGFGDGEEVLPLREGGEDLEWFGEFAGFVA